MGRIRTIKPEFWKHEVLSALPAETHMLAAALLNYADDEGYFNAHPGLVKAECFPLRECSVSVHQSLSELSSVGFIQVAMGSDGKQYGRIVKFSEHQRVNRPSPSKIKKLVQFDDDSVNAHGILIDTSLPEQGTGNREQGMEQGSGSVQAGKPASQPRKRKIPDDFQPTDDHRDQAGKLNVSLHDELQKFRDHFTANGKPMADWNAAFRNWLRRSSEFKREKSGGYQQETPQQRAERMARERGYIQ